MPPREVKTATIATDSFSGESKTKSRSNNEKFKIPLERIKELIENFGGHFVEFMDYVSSFLGWEDSEVDKTVTLREQLDEIRQEIDQLGESSTSVDENSNCFKKKFDTEYILTMEEDYSGATFISQCLNIKDCITGIFDQYLKGFTQDYLGTKNKLNNSHYTKSEIDTKINSINTSLLSVASEQADLLNNILTNDKIYKEKDDELEETINNIGMELNTRYDNTEIDTKIINLSRSVDNMRNTFEMYQQSTYSQDEVNEIIQSIRDEIDSIIAGQNVLSQRIDALETTSNN